MVGESSSRESTMRIVNLRTLIAVLSLAAILFPHSTTQNDETSSHNSPGNSKDLLYVTASSHCSNKPASAISCSPLLEWSMSRTRAEIEGGDSRRLTHREMQMLLRQEGGDEGRPVDCCPSVEEMVEPEGGKNKDDMYVVLFRNGDIRQRFYEYSCKENVVGKPCRFLDRRLHNQSRCVQKYAYTYAIVKNPSGSSSPMESGSEESQRHHNHHRPHHLPALPLTTSTPNSFGGSEWMLDHIRVRSGCGCEVIPKPKKKRATANKGKKTKSKKGYDIDDLK